MDMQETALALLPDWLKGKITSNNMTAMEEIRLRSGYRPTVLLNGAEYFIADRAITSKDIFCVLERATGASLHSASAQIAQGYISYKGVRVGVCGAATVREGELSSLKSYSSLAIRIPREIYGICDKAIEKICQGGFESTLVISPPGGGKTTALREIVRRLSENNMRVAVIDERGELAAAGEDGAAFLLGAHTDVLSGVDKERGAMMLLRGMNPQIIAMDEITKPTDIGTISNIYGCGVKLLASAHAGDHEELLSRTLYKRMLALGVFKYLIVIEGKGTARTYSVKRLER